MLGHWDEEQDGPLTFFSFIEKACSEGVNQGLDMRDDDSYVDHKFMQRLLWKLEHDHGIELPLQERNILLTYCRENCSANDEDPVWFEQEDPDYDPQDVDLGSQNRRTYHVLELILPSIEVVAGEKGRDLVEWVRRKIVSSRALHQRKMSGVQQWMQAVENSAPASDMLEHCTYKINSLQDLPTELIGLILLEAQRWNRRIHLAFSLVSRYCRAVVLATPLLWTKIDIMDSMGIWKLHLSRSIRLPIHVDMSQDSDLDTFFDVVVLPHWDRIQSIRAVFTTKGRAQAAAAIISRARMDALQTLELDLIDRGWPAQETIVDERDGGNWAFPSLRSLSLNNIQPTSPSRSIYSGLTTLNIGGITGLSLARIVQILAQASQLQSLTLYYLIFDRNPAPGPVVDETLAPIIANLPQLTELILGCFSPAFMASIVRSIVAPNIQNIFLSFAELEREGLDGVMFAIGVERNYIRNLDVRCMGVLPSADWLARFSELRRLRVVSPWFDLTPLRDSAICPYLEEFNLDNGYLMKSSVLRDVLSSRRIQSVSLRGWDAFNVDLNDLATLQETVPNLNVEVFQGCEFEGAETTGSEDSRSDSQSEGSWLSGDEWVKGQWKSY